MFVPQPQKFTAPGFAGPFEAPATCRARGLPEGTMIETALGWRPVEALRAGDLVASVDRGLRPLRDSAPVSRCGSGRVVIPEGVLCNNLALRLPPGQLVMVDGLALDRLFGLSTALLRAVDLVGLFGVREGDGRDEAVWQLRFDREEVIWAGGGMCLHCPAQMPGQLPRHARLTPHQARTWVQAMQAANLPGAARLGDAA